VTEVTPEARLWNILRGALATRALALVADLRVADALAAAPRSVEDIAQEVAADPDALRRILRALASDGVFAEQEPGIFRNTDVSDLLRRGSGWDEFAHLFGGIWHRAAGELDSTGEPPFPRLHGTDFWSWLADNPSERAAFDRAMAQGGDPRIERIASLDWRGDEVVVDVGGGNGSLLFELLRRQPGLRGVVLDLPETTRDEAAFGGRCTFVAGDFFESVPSGDAYVLSGILHDWDDERATAILSTIRDAASSNARLVVLEAVVPPGNESHGSKWLDLLMLALSGGRERDELQWRTLLSEAGFEPVWMEDGLIEARRR
jgi:hypothetical protein